MTGDLEPAVSVAGARRALATAFREAGLDTPELDARLLVGHALGLDRAALTAQSDRTIRGEEAERIRTFAARRIGREPVARIVGTKEFWSLPFVIAPAVLVPRPETETLVEAALGVVDAKRRQRLRIADLGTGSGALLLALLHELEGADGVGTDVSPAALGVARENCERLGLARRATFVACDFGAALGGGFDLVVSNPPYVVQRELLRLDPEVRNYDPKLALDGGVDGLAAYRRIAADARRLTARGAHIIVELGAGMADPVAAVFAAAGLAIRAVRPDLNGVPRALILRQAP
ncbi:MAG: peptide chain release factor N(5)-glutamine methyltransferase [Alphaproteobacteria bacterium]|nr:MAG: peptide chain release factor N(5)-glutamine methyltransferase [Alphaproteobacteria bacterium]